MTIVVLLPFIQIFYVVDGQGNFSLSPSLPRPVFLSWSDPETRPWSHI